jgi:hypothetical protein
MSDSGVGCAFASRPYGAFFRCPTGDGPPPPPLPDDRLLVDINLSNPDRKPEPVESSPEFRPPILFLKLLRIPFPPFSAGGSGLPPLGSIGGPFGSGGNSELGLLGGSGGRAAWDFVGISGGGSSTNAPGGRV